MVPWVLKNRLWDRSRKCRQITYGIDPTAQSGLQSMTCRYHRSYYQFPNISQNWLIIQNKHLEICFQNPLRICWSIVWCRTVHDISVFRPQVLPTVKFLKKNIYCQRQKYYVMRLQYARALFCNCFSGNTFCSWGLPYNQFY